MEEEDSNELKVISHTAVCVCSRSRGVPKTSNCGKPEQEVKSSGRYPIIMNELSIITTENYHCQLLFLGFSAASVTICPIK